MDEESYINSLKADIIPIINAELQMDENRLYSLNIEALNELFGILQTKIISVEILREIIINNSSSDAVINAINKIIQNPPPNDISIASADVNSPVSETMNIQDSIKADIIPVIQNMIDVSYEKLFSLSVDILNQIFDYLESGIISASKIESIILSSIDSDDISSRLQEEISANTPSGDNFNEDLIIGILFNIPESFRNQIEPKLREIENINKLVELSQLNFSEIQSRLGIETAIPQRYDERLDLIAGILAQLPPSLRGIISDRLQEIEDIDQLYRISQMNYVQVQQELGLAAQSPSAIPANIVNPVDTAIQSSTNSAPSATSSSSSHESQINQAPPQSARLQEMLRKRREENTNYIPFIQKMAEKVWKVKISEGNVQTPESAELKKKIEILQRIHPTRVEKILNRLKNTKNKKRFKALFDWYIYSQRIEEIETYVEHWQGQIQGIGGFRAAINVSRFDPIVEHLPTKEIEGIDIQSWKALERIHSSNLNMRARGVEDIKQISNYLLQKAR